MKMKDIMRDKKIHLMEKREGFLQEMDRLVEIVKFLRIECPWDRKQNHKSLRNHILEEAYEVAEAIDNDDSENLKEELGDVLLHLVFHSQLGEEEGNFTLEDVIREENNKLIRRHPHVFAKESVKTVDKVIEKWENIKREERGNEALSETLKKLPKSFSPLLRSYKIQSKAANIGFDWNDVRGALDKFREEMSEFEEALNLKDRKNMVEEFGDILFSLVNISRFLNINPDEALNKTNDKFIKRFAKMEEIAEKESLVIEELCLSDMDKLWDRAKLHLRNE